MESNKVSVVICHHKGDLFYQCLDSIKNIEGRKIFVTTDSTFPTIISSVILHPTLNNPALKRNIGTKYFNTKYFVFLDDDVEIKYDCIQRMENYLDNHSAVGMVYAMLYKMDNHFKIDTSGSFLTWCGFLYETYVNRIEPIPILSGKSACCMVRRDVFEQVGKFDEDFVIYG